MPGPKKIEDLAVEVGIPASDISALGVLLGFPPDGTVDENTVAMVTLTKQMMDGGLPWEAILEGARVYADSLRRLAEASIQMTHRYIYEPEVRAGKSPDDIDEKMASSIALIAPAAQELLERLYMRYMTEAVEAHARAHGERDEVDAPLGSVQQTVVFADMSLFSSFTYLEGDEAAVAMVDEFDRAVRGVTLSHNGRIVKQIGDEFMLVFREPVDGVRFALELRDRARSTEENVQLRTGIHHGSVIYRLGDYWGNAVNVAARIVSMAMPNSILVTEPVAKAAADDGIDVEEIGVRSLRGMEEPLALYRVR